MIEQKLKICKLCLKPKKIFSNGMCLTCSRIVKPAKPLKQSKIKSISKSQKSRNEKYSEKRTTYLESHKLCEAKLCGCTHISTDIHHKRGRLGKNLYDFFLAVCRECHRWIEEHPVEAKDLGFSESRLKEDTDEESS